MKYLMCLFVFAFMFLIGCSSDPGICKELKPIIADEDEILSCKYKRGTIELTYKVSERLARYINSGWDLLSLMGLRVSVEEEVTMMLAEDVDTANLHREEKDKFRFDRLVVHLIHPDNSKQTCTIEGTAVSACNAVSSAYEGIKCLRKATVCKRK